jgi:hypothetical protein
VRETLQWLDEATSKYPDIVTLQGADEIYERWAEVERFAVPRTMFSEQDYEPEHEEEGDEAADMPDVTSTKVRLSAHNLDASFSSAASDLTRSLSPSSLRSVRSSASPVSPPTSPAKVALSPMQNLSALATVSSRPQSSSGSVPQPLQPLFNYILWRVHQEVDPVAALESFIFLCNDPRKGNFAKGFDIKMKRLEQLREAVGREDRDHKNRQNLLIRETQNLVPTAAEPSHEPSPDDEVVFKPSIPKAPAAMLQKHSNVIDPNTFGRGPQSKPTLPIKDLPNGAPKSPRGAQVALHRGSPRGAHALPFAPRANLRGGPRGNFRGSARGRGNHGPAQSQNTFVADHATPDGQIDPDSFTRPDPRAGISGNRGGRKLWVPT